MCGLVLCSKKKKIRSLLEKNSCLKYARFNCSVKHHRKPNHPALHRSPKPPPHPPGSPGHKDSTPVPPGSPAHPTMHCNSTIDEGVVLLSHTSLPDLLPMHQPRQAAPRTSLPCTALCHLPSASVGFSLVVPAPLCSH